MVESTGLDLTQHLHGLKLCIPRKSKGILKKVQKKHKSQSTNKHTHPKNCPQKLVLTTILVPGSKQCMMQIKKLLKLRQISKILLVNCNDSKKILKNCNRQCLRTLKLIIIFCCHCNLSFHCSVFVFMDSMISPGNQIQCVNTIQPHQKAHICFTWKNL